MRQHLAPIFQIFRLRRAYSRSLLIYCGGCRLIVCDLGFKANNRYVCITVMPRISLLNMSELSQHLRNQRIIKITTPAWLLKITKTTRSQPWTVIPIHVLNNLSKQILDFVLLTRIYCRHSPTTLRFRHFDSTDLLECVQTIWPCELQAQRQTGREEILELAKTFIWWYPSIFGSLRISSFRQFDPASSGTPIHVTKQCHVGWQKKCEIYFVGISLCRINLEKMKNI